jgi:hypothetical protein
MTFSTSNSKANTLPLNLRTSDQLVMTYLSRSVLDSEAVNAGGDLFVDV